MANIVTLSNGNMTLSLLDTAAHILRPTGSINIPNVEKVFGTPWGRGYNPPAGRRSGNREDLVLPLKFMGTSVDNIITNAQQVRSILELAEVYFFDGDDNGDPAQLLVQIGSETNATVFDVFGGTLKLGGIFDYGMQQPAPFIMDAELTFICKPYTRPQALTRVTSSTLTNGGGTADSGGYYTQTRPGGEVLAPARVKYQTAAGDVWTQLILAHIAMGNVADIAGILRLQCETSVSSSYYTVTDVASGAPIGSLTQANAADGSASAGNIRRYTNNTAGAIGPAAGDALKYTLTGPLSSARGKYDAYLVVAANANARLTGATLKWGGSDGLLKTNALVSINNTARAVYPLGEFTLPAVDVGPEAVLNQFLMVLNLTVNFTSAANSFDLDTILLVPKGDIRTPVSAQLAKIEYASATTALDTITFDNIDPTPRTYLKASAGTFSQLAKSTSGPWLDPRFSLHPHNDHLWVPLALRKSGSDYTIDFTDQGTLTIEYYPLHPWLR